MDQATGDQPPVAQVHFGLPPRRWPGPGPGLVPLLLLVILALLLTLTLLLTQPMPAASSQAQVTPSPPAMLAPAVGPLRMSLALDPAYLAAELERAALPVMRIVPPAMSADDIAPVATNRRKKNPVMASAAQPIAAAAPAIHTTESGSDAILTGDSEEFRRAKQFTPQQVSENAYRQALAKIDAGQLTEAISILENILQSSPKQALARQALVDLLIDTGRPEDAMRRLQQGLALDPAQPSLAMLLARLQVEHGSLQVALATLQSALPHAAGDADFQAFLGALLQRDRRHKDAAEHYAMALRRVPQNGLWWMGYGISLQAENRLAEAADAYGRAATSPLLSAELREFVELKLAQVRR